MSARLSFCLFTFWFGDYSDETAIIMPTPLLDRDSWRTTCGLLASLWSVDTLQFCESNYRSRVFVRVSVCLFTLQLGDSNNDDLCSCRLGSRRSHRILELISTHWIPGSCSRPFLWIQETSYFLIKFPFRCVVLLIIKSHLHYLFVNLCQLQFNCRNLVCILYVYISFNKQLIIYYLPSNIY